MSNGIFQVRRKTKTNKKARWEQKALEPLAPDKATTGKKRTKAYSSEPHDVESMAN